MKKSSELLPVGNAWFSVLCQTIDRSDLTTVDDYVDLQGKFGVVSLLRRSTWPRYNRRLAAPTMLMELQYK